MSPKRVLAGVCGAALAGSLAVTLPPAAAAAPHQAQHIVVHGAPGRVINPRTAKPTAARSWNHSPLLRDGTYSGSDLAHSVTVGRKPVGGNTVSPQARVTSENFEGLRQSSPSCVCAAIPEANSAVGPSNVVEVVQSQLAVYSKSGTQALTVGLNTLLGTTNALAFPRIIYDPLWNRWILSVEGLAPTTTDYAQIWTVVSTTADPTGTWYVFHQDIFWAGLNGIADYPMIGMDRDSLLVSSNNYSYDSGTETHTYASTTAYAIPKAIIYNSSAAWTSAVFFMAFGTVPAIVTGNPTPDAAKTFMIGADLTNGKLHIYSLANSDHFGRQVFRQLTDAAYAFGPPSRRAKQPGTAVTLDTGDGRISSPPSQVGSRVWFADAVDLLGYPGVRWGYVTTSASPATHTAVASHNGSSDDFNPALAVVNNAGGTAQAILTWAYTDALNNVAVHDTWDTQAGLTPHAKSGTGYSPAGGSTLTGDMGTVASVAVDYSPPCGTSAVVTNQYFLSNGTWRTRLAEVGNC